MRWMLIAAVCLTGGAGCHRYDEDQMIAVCRDEVGYADSAPYNRATADGPIAIVQRSANGGSWFMYAPEMFTKAGMTEPTADNAAKTQLAYCIDQRPGAFDRDCGMDDMNATIDIGNDYKTDVHSTGHKSTLKAYASHYMLTVREAKTARVISQRTIDVPVRHCPMLTLGDSHSDYATIGDEALRDAIVAALPPALIAQLHPEPDL